ncbi:MAG: hypothetical protein RL685_558 [Pseudomonadota bacterium]
MCAESIVLRRRRLAPETSCGSSCCGRSCTERLGSSAGAGRSVDIVVLERNVALRGQLSSTFRARGGRRRGTGRPPKGEVSGVSHARREQLSRHHAAHITLRVRRGLPSMRGSRTFAQVRAALAAGRERFGFRLVHFSVQRDHLHLLAEAANRHALSRGTQGLTVRLARGINRFVHSKGRVFPDRYHDRILKTPRAVRMALRYVLLNARKHERSAVPSGFVDACSSAPWFEAFLRPATLVFGASAARAAWQCSSRVAGRRSHSSFRFARCQSGLAACASRAVGLREPASRSSVLLDAARSFVPPPRIRAHREPYPRRSAHPLVAARREPSLVSSTRWRASRRRRRRRPRPSCSRAGCRTPRGRRRRLWSPNTRGRRRRRRSGAG